MKDPIKNITESQLAHIKHATHSSHIWLKQNLKYIKLPNSDFTDKPIAGHNISCDFEDGLFDTTTTFNAKDGKYHTAMFGQDGFQATKRVGIPSTNIIESIKNVSKASAHDVF